MQNLPKNSTSLTNKTKNATVLSAITKHATSFVNLIKNIIDPCLLKEDGYYILLETGGRILLEEANIPANSSKNSTSFTNLVKS